jgi:hypothetical protein
MSRLSERASQVSGLSVPTQRDSRMTRASDDDRRRVSDLLQAHYVAGRLSSNELEERVEQSLDARTLADLDMLVADLPLDETSSPRRASNDRRSARRADRHLPREDRHHLREKGFRAHATSYLMVMALLVTIWLLTTPGGYFWPVWPMLGWGIGLASHGLATRGGANCGSERPTVAA